MTIAELALKRESALVGTSAARITLFAGAMAVVPERDTSLAAFIEEVRGGDHAARVAEIREVARKGNMERLAWLKRQLPAVTLSCTMTSRAKGAPVRARTHSGWMQADFDGKDNVALVQDEMRSALAGDPHVGAVFVGPSGVGIKCAVRIDGTRHTDSFHAAEAYFLKHYGLQIDKACKDTERLCFLSHDPDAWLRPDEAVILPVPEKKRSDAEEPEDQAPDPARPAALLPDANWSVEDVRELLTWIPKRPDYDTWLRVASGVFSVLPFQSGAQVLSEWSPEEKPGEYSDKWKNRLQHVTIRSVIKMAADRGFDARAAARRQRWAGRLVFGKGVERGGAPHLDLLREDVEPEGYERALDLWARFEECQRGDAEVFRGRRGRDYAFDPGAKLWRTYNQRTGLWVLDNARTTHTAIAETAAEAYERLRDTVEEEIKAQPAKGKKDSRIDELNAIKKRIELLRTVRYTDAVATEASRFPGLHRSGGEYNQHRHLLAVQNGVIDFKKMVHRPPMREDLLTVAAPVSYQEGATCPKFDAFLHRALDGDTDLIDYWWRAVGYCLTGYVDHDVLFFCYGSGSNGKSTANMTVQMLLGDDLYCPFNVQNLLDTQFDSNALYARAALEGKRLVITDELPDGRALNEAAIKTLLGGEKIAARSLYQAPRAFSPTHKIWMVGNHKPRVAGTDHGIWRRIHLIPFVVQIPKPEQRKREELLEEFRVELSGILNRAIAGYMDFLERGHLDPPKAVIDATADYRHEEDTLAQFLADTITTVPEARILCSDLWTKYREWCERSGEKPKVDTLNKFTRTIQRDPYSLEVDRGRGLRVVINSAWASVE